MTKNIIYIYGASGSGTSSLGRYAAEQLGYLHMDTDDYYWLPTDPKYVQKRGIQQRIELMKQDMERAEDAVISGSLAGWGDELIPYFTLAVRVDTDTDLRIKRLKDREYRHFGDRIRPGGDMYKNHLEFMEWAAEYDHGDVTMRSKARHDEWQKQLSCRQILVDGGRELEENLRLIKQALQVS